MNNDRRLTRSQVAEGVRCSKYWARLSESGRELILKSLPHHQHLRCASGSDTKTAKSIIQWGVFRAFRLGRGRYWAHAEEGENIESAFTGEVLSSDLLWARRDCVSRYSEWRAAEDGFPTLCAWLKLSRTRRLRGGYSEARVLSTIHSRETGGRPREVVLQALQTISGPGTLCTLLRRRDERSEEQREGKLRLKVE